MLYRLYVLGNNRDGMSMQLITFTVVANHHRNLTFSPLFIFGQRTPSFLTVIAKGKINRRLSTNKMVPVAYTADLSSYRISKLFHAAD